MQSKVDRLWVRAGLALRQNRGALLFIATPAWLPFRNVISVGDLIILIGVGILVHVVTRSHLAGNATAVGRHRQSTRSESEQVSSAA